jgi:protein-S-isoprenylcysteine O-methyltransferase Ste14
MNDNHPSRPGKRGEWLVVVQLLLMALVFFGPRTLPALPSWPSYLGRISLFAGIGLAILGGGLLFAGGLSLGSDLTPLPYPRTKANLVQTGPYRIVRHPMYAGGFLLALGWALFVRGWLTLVYVAILLVFLDYKSTREERWLTEKFPDYEDYQRRVRKLIPFVY